MIILFSSCGPEPKIKKLTYQNIVILSDMSSRLLNKPPKDIQEIQNIVQFFKNECVKPGEKIGDKSSLTFSTFAGEEIASIDLEKIKNLVDKQEFINNKGKYKNSGLNFQISDFQAKVNHAYKNTHNQGLDLISALIDKIKNKDLIKRDTFSTYGIDTTYTNYDNHIYLFTDGYLEYLNKSVNSQFYFGSAEIDKVRQFCIANKIDAKTAIENNASLSLPAYKNSNNQFIHLHVLETHERDKNERLQTYKNPIGLRDNEILEAVWRKWAKESGFKSFEWKKY
jgi:hypothetical protein